MAHLQEREVYLLRTLGQRRYLNREQIGRLFYFDRGEQTAQWNLRRLAGLGLVERALYRDVAGLRRGMTPYVYWLSRQGARFVAGEFGEEVSLPRGRTAGGTYDPTVEHTLVVNEFWVQLVEAWRAGRELIGMGWRDEWGGAMLRLPRGEKTMLLRPDAYVQLLFAPGGNWAGVAPMRSPGPISRWEMIQNWAEMFPKLDMGPTSSQVPVPAFVEVSLGKEGKAQIERKMQKYRYFQLTAPWAKYYAVPRIKVGSQSEPFWPCLLVITTTEQRMRTEARLYTAGYPERRVLATCRDRANQAPGGLVLGNIWWCDHLGQDQLNLRQGLRAILLASAGQSRPAGPQR